MSVARIRFFFFAALAMAPAYTHAADVVSFAANDSVQVFADYYSAGSKAKPLILLFHQAGSNRGEYATIGPMLATLGFNALAIDQRSGGNAWGRTNETVLDRSSYGEAVIQRLWCSCSLPVIGVRSRPFSHSHPANICTAHRPCGKPRHRFRYPYS